MVDYKAMLEEEFEVSRNNYELGRPLTIGARINLPR